mmetsp:Transcript_76689/g.206668  ORF Transcript_76689/g.206668 Transcript_76689/m.206668 type:complete len:153 (+) Transcript_76689:320-778(+)
MQPRYTKHAVFSNHWRNRNLKMFPPNLLLLAGATGQFALLEALPSPPNHPAISFSHRLSRQENPAAASSPPPPSPPPRPAEWVPAPAAVRTGLALVGVRRRERTRRSSDDFEESCLAVVAMLTQMLCCLPPSTRPVALESSPRALDPSAQAY